MQEEQSWREILGQMLQNAEEKFRISQELQVTNMTLQRWVRGESVPQPAQMQRLIRILPQHKQQLLTTLSEQTTDQGRTFLTHTETEIPSIFYAHILGGSSTLPYPLRFWTLSNLILQQALGQLDLQHRGLIIRVVSCVPPQSDSIVRSLCVRTGMSSVPGQEKQSAYSCLLGAETLAGRAITSGTTASLSLTLNAETAYNDQSLLETSNAAYLIQRGGGIAGCLLISSAQADFFTRQREIVAQRYADLMTTAFESQQFYARWQFMLQSLPSPAAQAEPLTSFHEHMHTILSTASGQGASIDTEQAETLVWQQYEQAFISAQTQGGSNLIHMEERFTSAEH